MGVGVAVGAQTGVYVYAEASVGSSKSNADSTSWQNTTLTGQNISLKAEGDTTLRGATATADRIDVKTGGTLTIESLQDVAESMSKNSQVGGRVQVSFGTAWSADGYASAGKSNGSYQGVGQQSGLFAGDGGYHVDAGHVNLVGGAIASTNTTNSELTAQTLTFSDLQNQMQHSTSSGGISGGYGGAMEGNTPVFAGATPNFGGGVPMHESGSDSSTTYATLTEGNIVIGGKKVTAAELGVNTDAATAHRAIDAMPNAELQLANQQAMANAMGTVVATSKQIAGDIGNQAMRDLENSYLSTLSDEEKDRFKSQSAEGKSNELAARFPYSYSDAVAQQQNWGIGSQNGRALEAVTTLLVGVVSGQGGGQVAANALAPYAAQLIGDKFDTNHGSDPNAALQLLSHALLGALLAEANGGNAASGAGAAAGGELAAKLLTEALYPGYTGELNDQQKQTILALSQAVGAVAGGIGGGGVATAALGANLARNAVENNRLLSDPEKAALRKLGAEGYDIDKINAVACAIAKCWEGAELGVMSLAVKEQIAAVMATLTDQQKDELLASLRNEAPGHFKYSTGDKISDWWMGSPSIQDAVVRAGGALQATGGYVTAVAGAGTTAVGGATCFETGVGCFALVGGVAMLTWGADNMVAGGTTWAYGTQQPTAGGLGISALTGMSPQNAELTYSLLGMAPASAQAYALNRAVNLEIAENAYARATYLNPLLTRRSEAYFWSGLGPGGYTVAAGVASGKGGTTLEMLIDSRKVALPTWDAANPASVKAWQDVSSAYAESASGTVRAVVGPNLRPGNIWETFELPALKQNPKVDKIMTVDPSTGKEKLVWSRK